MSACLQVYYPQGAPNQSNTAGFCHDILHNIEAVSLHDEIYYSTLYKYKEPKKTATSRETLDKMVSEESVKKEEKNRKNDRHIISMYNFSPSQTMAQASKMPDKTAIADTTAPPKVHISHPMRCRRLNMARIPTPANAKLDATAKMMPASTWWIFL